MGLGLVVLRFYRSWPVSGVDWTKLVWLFRAVLSTSTVGRLLGSRVFVATFLGKTDRGLEPWVERGKSRGARGPKLETTFAGRCPGWRIIVGLIGYGHDAHAYERDVGLCASSVDGAVLGDQADHCGIGDGKAGRVG